jgi:hypothetical protein
LGLLQPTQREAMSCSQGSTGHTCPIILVSLGI